MQKLHDYAIILIHCNWEKLYFIGFPSWKVHLISFIRNRIRGFLLAIFGS